jgi:GPH family glycoside/pentoside/hexuronide:cation symporter
VSKNAPAGKLPLHIRAIYGLGDFGTSAATTARTLFWFIFLTNVVGMRAAWVGVILLVGRLWDSINDPLVGTLSDRVNTRWGRRRPFLLVFALPFGFLFALTFVVPPFTGEIAKAVYFIIVFLFFDTVYTLINVPYSALAPELSSDYDERSSLAGWRIAASILATLVTGAVFILLAEDVFAPRFGGVPDGLESGYAITAAIWGLMLAVPPLLLFAVVREPAQHKAVTSPIRPVQTFKEVFANRPFRLAASIYLLSFAAVDVVLLIFVRYLIDYIRVDPGFENLLLGTLLGVALLSMPLNVWLMRRLGKRVTYIFTMSYFIVVLLIVGLVQPGGQNWMLFAALLAGLGYGAASAVPWAIVADVVEADELAHGERREGVYFGYLVFFRKLAGALSAFVVSILLDQAGYLSSTTGTLPLPQPESALQMMRFVVSIVPAVLFSLAVLVAWRYPLTRDAYNEIRRQLQERHEREAKQEQSSEIATDTSSHAD